MRRRSRRDERDCWCQLAPRAHCSQPRHGELEDGLSLLLAPRRAHLARVAARRPSAKTWLAASSARFGPATELSALRSVSVTSGLTAVCTIFAAICVDYGAHDLSVSAAYSVAADLPGCAHFVQDRE